VGEPIETAGDHTDRAWWNIGHWQQQAGGWRGQVRSNPGTHRLYKTVVGIIGAIITIGGLALVPLPGPGWFIVFIGLAILASEFEWARRLQNFAKRQVRAWTQWLRRQTWPLRYLLSLATLAFILAILYVSAVLTGGVDWIRDLASTTETH
jgi:uncharacterized protein (TIGR02611 family)